jgi:lipoyl synthase
VERLTPLVRDRRAGFRRSVGVLRNVKRFEPSVLTKSSLMLGLGETDAEVKEAILRLHEARVDMLTLGQYLRPDKSLLPVRRYVPPEEFDELKNYALGLGFKSVVAAPFARSSYRAPVYFKDAGRHR